jgi:hypothetical protein
MNMAVEGEDFHGAKLALFVGGGGVGRDPAG